MRGKSSRLVTGKKGGLNSKGVQVGRRNQTLYGRGSEKKKREGKAQRSEGENVG